MYEQGKTPNFDADRFFDQKRFWYHIASNSRPQSSVWRKVQGRATTCDNVITQYMKIEPNVYGYRNGCYVKGQYKKSLLREGTLKRSDPESPSKFVMTDKQSNQESPFQIFATDYDNFALITDGGTTFWVLSRSAEICGNLLGKLNTRVKQLGLDTAQITVDFGVVKDCADTATVSAPSQTK